MGRLSIEVKVGAFLLAAAGLLTAFVLVLGNFRMSPARSYIVNYTASGGLREGAKVKLAGVSAGKVLGVRFLGGEQRDSLGGALWVGVEIEVDEEKARAITEGSRFFVSSEGMLGEKYVEISPGDPDAAEIPDGSVLTGEPVLELQMVTSQAMEMMKVVREVVDSGGGGMGESLEDIRGILAKGNRILGELEGRLPRLAERADALVVRMDELAVRTLRVVERVDALMVAEGGIESSVMTAGRVLEGASMRLPGLMDEAGQLLVEGRGLAAQASHTLEGLDGLSAAAEAELHGVALEGRRLIASTSRLLAGIDAPDMARRFMEMSDELTRATASLSVKVEAILERSDRLVSQLTELLGSVERGGGTVGLLLRERELYDDIRELVLDLKKNPWKALWKQ